MFLSEDHLKFAEWELADSASSSSLASLADAHEELCITVGRYGSPCLTERVEPGERWPNPFSRMGLRIHEETPRHCHTRPQMRHGIVQAGRQGHPLRQHRYAWSAAYRHRNDRAHRRKSGPESVKVPPHWLNLRIT